MFQFRASPVGFEMIWNDYLLCIVAARGGGSMSYEIIGIFDLSSIANDANDSALNIAASNDAAGAAGTRPLARTPDRTSSTR